MSPGEQNLLTPPEERPLLESGNAERLQQEIDSLRREVEQLRRNGGQGGDDKGDQGDQGDDKNGKHEDQAPRRPRGKTLWLMGAALVIVLAVAFFTGWLPRHNREKKIQQEAQQEARALPQLDYVLAQSSAPTEELLLPGTTEALVDAPVLARADGYVAQRLVDIGDRVKKGQLLAVIAAPDLDQQVVQGRAQVSQAEAALKQASANLGQGRANEALARVTAARYENLVQRGAVSRQDNDTQQATWHAQAANVEALDQALSAANDNVASARANLQRLLELQSFERITAPFDGVVTLRNTDVGALITSGSSLLFRVAQTQRLRTYINVPQPNAPSVTVGQEARLISPEFGARQVTGRVTRSAEALDPASRTLLTEVQVANPHGDLRPGMFVEVSLKSLRKSPPVLVPGDALIAGPEGTQVAVIRDAHQVEAPPLPKQEGGGEKKTGGQQKSQEQKKPRQAVEGTVHLQQIQVGRDYGAATEVYSGLSPGDLVIVNPNDIVRENVRVQGLLTAANLDVRNAAPGASKQNANSEKMQPAPGGEQPSRQPSKTDKSRGPGY